MKQEQQWQHCDSESLPLVSAHWRDSCPPHWRRNQRDSYHSQQNYDRIMSMVCAKDESASTGESLSPLHRPQSTMNATETTATVMKSPGSLRPWKRKRALTSRESLWTTMILVGCGIIGLATISAATTTGNTTRSSKIDGESSPFIMIVDGGSTGSRLHIFEFTRIDDVDSVERRGSFRTDLPLSAYVPATETEDEEVEKDSKVKDGKDASSSSSVCSEHVKPLLEAAARTIPKMWHRSTPIYYAATAGMRLVSPYQQQQVYQAVHACIMVGGVEEVPSQPQSSFQGAALAGPVFDIQPSYIATLSGELEGYYGAVAANYLLGKLHVNMTLKSTPTTVQLGTESTLRDQGILEQHSIVGALDMGGSSTQMVFHHNPKVDSEGDNTDASIVETDSSMAPTCDASSDAGTTTESTPKNAKPSSPSGLQPEHFFSISYLSYGVDQMRERLYLLLIQEEWNRRNESKLNAANITVSNPCANPGYTATTTSALWRLKDGTDATITLAGSGDAESCARHVRRLIPDPNTAMPRADESITSSASTPYLVGGIQHPPVTGRRFLAMSLYFFAFDAVRTLTGNTKLHAAWPTPSLDELSNALPELCGMDWTSQLMPLDGTHRYTRTGILPHRCFEAVYMATLLQHGFGFDRHSRHITYAFDVKDSEVEWTLGMALQLRANQKQRRRRHRRHTLPVEDATGDASPTANDEKLPPSSVCNQKQQQQQASDKHESNATFENDEDEATRLGGWVQMVAELLVSDGELFSGDHQYIQ